MPTDILFCIGPLRSGLSPLTACARQLGFQEFAVHSKPVSINAELFQELGCSPTSMGPLPENWIKTEVASQAREQAKKCLAQCIAAGGHFFTSDPLFCRTLPLWLQVLDQKKSVMKAKFILLLRHPWETAHSLIANGHHQNLHQAHMYWLSCVQDVLRALGGQHYFFITYDQLLADPVATCNSFLSSATKNSELITDNIQPLLELVHPSLKNHQIHDHSQSDREPFEPYTQFYNQMRTWHGKGVFPASDHNNIGVAAAKVVQQPGSFTQFESTSTGVSRTHLTPLLEQVLICEQRAILNMPPGQESLLKSEIAQGAFLQKKFDDVTQNLKKEIKAEVNAEIKANNPNPYAHNRTLTPALNKSLREFGETKLPLQGLKPAYIDYLAAHSIQIERNCVGRLATTVQDAITRQLVVESIQGHSICILEIGALYGVSLAILYNHAVTRFADVKVVCLDPFDGYYGKALDALLNQPVNDLTFIRNMRLANVPESDYRVIKHYSTQPEAFSVARELQDLNLLIIDGDHSYEGVKYDFDTYFPLLQPGGYVIFDDYNAKEWPGVQKFIDEDVRKVSEFEYLGSLSRSAVGRKRLAR